MCTISVFPQPRCLCSVSVFISSSTMCVHCGKYRGPSRFLGQLWTREAETKESMSSSNVSSCLLRVRTVQSRKAVFVGNSCWQSARAGLSWRCVLPALFVECNENWQWLGVVQGSHLLGTPLGKFSRHWKFLYRSPGLAVISTGVHKHGSVFSASFLASGMSTEPLEQSGSTCAPAGTSPCPHGLTWCPAGTCSWLCIDRWGC